ncbi:aminotransferase class V-fold PLP-dependent enzyme [Marinomonas mediterranea]|jgi:Selenocysteine lyase|uniref:Kynureninase n=1 Tax=Marinomonas mediterranea (strain ATCC 700492 / JCM 21426 / NBRC 103028 / MMB-1) TaxID=717774 RepID=F2JUA3_MARM1|nr:aminotransferase class V-fold PLP-dependent enzyme [Marinomonas mediterranea]ADZ92722.1 Kynureninase [Marinomonas mediterranea MMB-1]WCN18751.1 aminotransferase class V-fold PLP-dependent enzyme [Marinomonas mediterranea MMB-1]
MQEFTQKDGIYLLNHSVGLMPASTRQAAESQFFANWEHGTPDPWATWFPMFEQFTTRLATLFNTESRMFCPQQNVSSGLSKLLSAFPDASNNEGRNVILLTENDFPSIGFVMQQAQQMGYQIEYIKDAEDVLDVTVWEEHLTENVFTALITHGHYNSGRLVPVTEIVQAARKSGVMSIVDIAQTAGVIPIDFSEWQADVVVGSCVKWLCGGPGAGYLWVNDSVLSMLNPFDVGWFSHENPFEFDIHNFKYADSALRFWGGTPSVIPYVIAANSIDLMHSIGIKNVRAHNVKLADKIIDAIPESWLVSPKDDQVRTGTLVINPPNRDAVEEKLKAINVHYDLRKRGFRLSPHIYNTHEQIDKVITAFL